MSNFSNPSVAFFKERLKELSVLGQHLWVAKLEGIPVCLCAICTKCRKMYHNATGLQPTIEQEQNACAAWGRGCH